MVNFLWLQGGACSGNTMSSLNAEEATACDLVTDFGISNVQETTSHSSYKGDRFLHPWQGETNPIDPLEGHKQGLELGTRTIEWARPGAACRRARFPCTSRPDANWGGSEPK
jgi:hypothetical protein